MAYRNTEGLNYLQPHSAALRGYFVTDHLGSVVGVMDASGTLLEETRYMPFGSVREGVGVQGTDLGFTGQRGLPTTGLMDYNARMYDPALGRFIQPDTIVPGAGDTQAWNRYSYVGNTPVNATDPSGNKAGDVDPYGHYSIFYEDPNYCLT